MKQASAFEKFAARCWNLLNEGKPFTPIFTIGTMLIYSLPRFGQDGYLTELLIGFLAVVPLLVLYFVYDFPLFLRNYIWMPVMAFLMVWHHVNYPLIFLAVGLYFFFTVFFWGTLYYHLRIGTDWLNFTRFWKLVLKNSDSTSGNAQEQLPKFLLILLAWDYAAGLPARGLGELGGLFLFYAAILLFAFILHRYLFDWKPVPYSSYTRDTEKPATGPINNRVIVFVIDGMRKERFDQANTPFLDNLRKNGTDYSLMETVYPARTVVCFSSMFTGTYPFEHGITSNMVWKLGLKVESIFDSLRKVGKKGSLLGIAHLVDSFGERDVDTVTAVMHKDKADRNIIERAKMIMDEKDPDLQIIQLIGTDQIGHSRGVLYDEYIEKIEEADALAEEYFNWLKQKGKLENATFIVCADHGQADGIGGHGHLDEGERYVPFFMHGPAIEQGKRIDEKRSLVSLAPTIAYLLGAPFPSHSRGPILMESIRRDTRK
ncbi:alkaline phosphatase family protein [Neobacillus piezotolerans]|uniref:Alkaline phosphatase family protein n=1 Tax=Neobacillus piezotolerans TaxID=2259171 RepID=A0A3D8GPQ3_9BACI|nr:alkaline phosphatase family protein [Neobacillus piezotolerans]RDU36261.1 alkaline phosphatase family protein [Neobacillus piezotolerans]